jgi:hypothetical protein
MHAAVEEVAGAVFADAEGADAVVKSVIVERIGDGADLAGRTPLTPLLEEEGDAGAVAIVAELTGPCRVHGAGVGAALATADEPVDALWDEGSFFDG